MKFDRMYEYEIKSEVTYYGNVVHKLTQSEIDQLLSQIQFETTQLPQGMRARTKYQNTTINISFRKGHVPRKECRISSSTHVT